MLEGMMGGMESHQSSIEAGAARRKAEDVAGQLKLLQRQVDRLALASQAMWELLAERAGVSEAELDARIREVDQRDGKLDGKISPQFLNCTGCGHPTNSRRQTCMMCGAEVPRQHRVGG